MFRRARFPRAVAFFLALLCARLATSGEVSPLTITASTVDPSTQADDNFLQHVFTAPTAGVYTIRGGAIASTEEAGRGLFSGFWLNDEEFDNEPISVWAGRFAAGDPRERPDANLNLTTWNSVTLDLNQGDRLDFLMDSSADFDVLTGGFEVIQYNPIAGSETVSITRVTDSDDFEFELSRGGNRLTSSAFTAPRDGLYSFEAAAVMDEESNQVASRFRSESARANFEQGGWVQPWGGGSATTRQAFTTYLEAGDDVEWVFDTLDFDDELSVNDILFAELNVIEYRDVLGAPIASLELNEYFADEAGLSFRARNVESSFEANLSGGPLPDDPYLPTTVSINARTPLEMRDGEFTGAYSSISISRDATDSVDDFGKWASNSGRGLDTANSLFMTTLSSGDEIKLNINGLDREDLRFSATENRLSAGPVNLDFDVGVEDEDLEEFADEEFESALLEYVEFRPVFVAEGSETIAGERFYSNLVIGDGDTLTVANNAFAVADALTVLAGGNLVVESGGFAGGEGINLLGTATVNGRLSGRFTVGPGGEIRGSGLVDRFTLNGGSIAPGNSTGTLSGSTVTWGPDGSYQFEVNDFDGTAGSTGLGWDLLDVSNNLTITSTAANPFEIDVISLTAAQAAGLAQNFDQSQDESLVIAQAFNIIGFDPSKFTIDTSGFQNDTFGTWSLSQSGGNLLLNYTATVPEPSSLAILGIGLSAAWWRRRRQASTHAKSTDVAA